MDIKGKLKEKQPPSPKRMVSRDLSRAKEGASASAAELKQFMSELRGQSPQQMLGAIAQSDLVRSTFIATLGSVVLLGVLTLGPWMLSGDEAGASSKKGKAASANSVERDDKTDDANTVATKKGDGDAKGDGKQAAAKNEDDILGDDKTGAAKKLGIDEVKTGQPDIDPFKGGGDDLLDP